ncbi:DUF4142 domain-containing protein [Methylocella silvestris]|uniref:DUF305 domain-containing protein n=1 Tax=Methylocella silvestris TaxID=199596 RepID=A0A2J7THL4_METSI|nr:DUF4142 domain-containing protein [Methylocella silvestris]PNG26258.1 DUF305 domain-containing protein [Methylocella silvestris]
MKRAIMVGAALIAFTSFANAESLAEKTGINSVLGVSPSTSDFVRQVAISDMFEIESSRLAKEKGDVAATAFANHMISAHEKTSQQLKSLVSERGLKVELPAGLDKSHEGKLDDLKKLSGGDFTKSYKDEQVKAHKAAVDLFDRYAKAGDNDSVKQWAATTLPELRAHLDIAEKL